MFFSSSLLQSPKTHEKIRDISRLCGVSDLDKTQYVNESVVRSSLQIDEESNDDFEEDSSYKFVVDPIFPEDITKEFYAEQVVIDCNSLKSPLKSASNCIK